MADEETELRLLRKGKRWISASLCTSTSGSPAAISRVIQAETAVRCICEVADFVRNLEGLTHHITSKPRDVSSMA